MSRTFLYARVSTNDQDAQNQVLEAKDKGFDVRKDRVVCETISGTVAAMDRPLFAKLVDKLEAGDTLVCTKLDRLGRNTTDVTVTVDALHSKGVKLHCLAIPGVDLTSPAGRFTMTVLLAVAQFERELIVERTHAGLAKARSEGRVGGRPDALTDEQKQAIMTRLAGPDAVSARALAKEYGVSPNTILKLRPYTD
ncbi:recombinase family protein [Paraburkholderia fungorum]|uniref:recombinase family protein n=1 Tax=Paraburkholderia fungorum TaxID=134537 RepID=UPI0038B9F0B1